MIIIVGRFSIPTEKRAEFLDFAREVVKGQRGEGGCIAFDICEDITHSNHFVMLEMWENRDVLEAHFASAAYAHHDNRLNAIVSGEPAWEEYETQNEG